MGFSQGFYQYAKEFHQRGRLNKAIDETFFTLILRVPFQCSLGVIDLSVWLGLFRSLLSKVLSNRLKHVLQSSEYYYLLAFSKGPLCGISKIWDGILIAHELIDSRKQIRKEGLILS